MASHFSIVHILYVEKIQLVWNVFKNSDEKIWHWCRWINYEAVCFIIPQICRLLINFIQSSNKLSAVLLFLIHRTVMYFRILRRNFFWERSGKLAKKTFKFKVNAVYSDQMLGNLKKMFNAGWKSCISIFLIIITKIADHHHSLFNTKYYCK